MHDGPTATDGTRPGLTRRDFLRSTSILAGVGLLPSWLLAACSRGGVVDDVALDPVTYGPTGDAPWSTLRAMQAAVRRSPDHHPARAAALVADGDAEGILRFVTDELRTLPTGQGSFDDPVGQVRWGHEAALRCGAGTPRELADLAVALLAQVGVDARVRAVATDAVPDARTRLLSTRRGAAFVLDVPDAEVDAWLEETGATPARPSGPDAADRDDAATTLTDRLLGVLGDRAREQARGASLEARALPVVEVDLPGGTRVAVPAVPGSGLLDPATLPLVDAGAAVGRWRVTATLLAARTADPDALEPLVTGTWDAADLIGNQLRIQLAPGLTLEEAVVTPIAAVRTFVPTLVVRGPRLALEDGVARSVVGDAVDVTGARVTASDEPGVALSVDGVPLLAADAPGAGRPEDVADVTVEVDARAFPELLVHVTPTDRQGRIVEGLQAADLAVIDEGVAMPSLLTSNRPSPRVALLVDQSRSMPDAYQGEGAEALLAGLEDAVRRRYPSARVSLFRTDSDIWRWLDVAIAQRPDLTVFVTDGDQDGAVSDATLARLASSGPTLFLDAVGDDPSRFDPFLATTRGSLARVADADAAIARVAETIDAFRVAPYRVSVRASSDAPALRTLGVEVVRDGRRLGPGGRATYTVPPTDERVLPEALCTLGLRVVLARDGDTEVTVERTLAGRDPRVGLPATADDLARVRDALWGVHLLAVEGGGLSASVRIDDLLEGQLGSEGLFRALAAGEPVIPELEAPDRAVPGELLGMLAVVADPEDRALVHEHGLRMVLTSAVQRIGTDRVERWVDVLPTALFHGADPDPRTSFEATLRATARLAVLEAEALADLSPGAVPDSTARLLDGAELALGSYPSDLGVPSGEEYDRWYAFLGSNILAGRPRPYRIARPGGGRLACWSIDPGSGELLALLEGRGGTRMETAIAEATKEFDDVMSLYQIAFSMMGTLGVSGFALSVIAEYMKNVVKLYAAVTYVLINMSAEGLDDAIALRLLSMVCTTARELALGILFSGLPGKGAIDGMVGIISVLLGKAGAPLLVGARCPT